jgi:putative ATP-dependent endonuclease of the OLD family
MSGDAPHHIIRWNVDIKIMISFDPPLTYTKFSETDPVEITTLSFEYTRYKIGNQKGQRRLEQKCLTANGKPPMVLAKAPKKGEQRQYQALVGIPSEIREAIPVIYVGTNRSLKEHLPNARYSLLRYLLEDIDRDLRNSGQTVVATRSDGSQIEMPRSQYFQGFCRKVAFSRVLMSVSH